MLRDFVEHGTHDPEEYPFSEEIQVWINVKYLI